MSLAKTNPKTSPVIVPIDVEDLPKLPPAVRELDPEGTSNYEAQMQVYWLRLADAINSISEKVES